jgi:hypothetical protein
MIREMQCRLLEEKRVNQFKKRALASRLGYFLSDERCFLRKDVFFKCFAGGSQALYR